jgi:hypothetical protein
MNKLVRLAGEINDGPGSWERYLWTSMRRNERAFFYYQRKALTNPGSHNGLVATTFLRSADADRRPLGATIRRQLP